MTTIFKYKLKEAGMSRVEMPEDAKILCAKEQHGFVWVWAEVDPDAPTSVRMFEALLTGEGHYQNMGVSRDYVDTVLMFDGNFVVHVYERMGL